MFTIKTILHPTDFSNRSENAFTVACALAADYGANLVLVHVVSTPVILGEGVMLPAVVDCQDELRHKLQELEVPDDNVDVTRRLEEGNAAAEILRVALLCHADLIVMGTHARRGLKRLLMGSVAEQVVRRANCPVMTVATPLPGQQDADASYGGQPVAV